MSLLLLVNYKKDETGAIELLRESFPDHTLLNLSQGQDIDSEIKKMFQTASSVVLFYVSLKKQVEKLLEQDLLVTPTFLVSGNSDMEVLDLLINKSNFQGGFSDVLPEQRQEMVKTIVSKTYEKFDDDLLSSLIKK